MEEHQNNMDTDVQDNGTNSGDGPPKVIKAGSEAKAGRRVLRGGGASNGSNQEGEGVRDTEEVARNIMRAGQQATEGVKAASHATADLGESMGVGQVLSEYTSFTKRAYTRNTQAVGDLMHCYTFYSLLQWQSKLLNATVADFVETNTRILQLVTHKA